MQILSIRGANLASLAEPFEIDLSSEPLRSAGLFAITGDTGAGKSTILDALCLALYGDCPRLSQSGINDDVPDVEGESIKSSDPRSILRIGAYQGYAEACFVGIDGVAYKATWTARRARNKRQGRLQSVERSLSRVSDGTPLETQINAVKARVTELTGLSYEEMRRSVLLAQGDFDAFLNANTGERAALLEKVTRTGVYRRVSQRIYERHDQARRALERLEARKEGQEVLDETTRAELTTEKDDHDADLQKALAEHSRITGQIHVHEGLRQARDLVAQAEDREKKAAGAVSGAAADRTQLRNLEAALGMRAEHLRDTAAAGALRKAQTERDAARANFDSLSVKEEKARNDMAKAATNAHSAETLRQELEPEWARAASLDTQIATADREVRQAKERNETARATRQTCQSDIEKLVKDREGAEARRGKAEQALDRMIGAEAIVRNRDVVLSLIDDRSERREQLAEADRKKQAAEGRRNSALDRRNALDDKDRGDRAEIDRLGELQAADQGKLDEIVTANPAAEQQILAGEEQALQEMLRHVEQHAFQAERAAEADQDIAQHQTAKEKAGGARAAAQTEVERARTAIAALEAPVDRAEAAVSDHASFLRRSLEIGAPCPVCGALEHPVEEDSTLAEIARSMRADLEGERSALETARTALDGAARDEDVARLALETARQTRDSAMEAAGAARTAYDRIRTKAALEGIPATPEDGKDALEARLGRLSTRKTELADQVGRQWALQKTVNDRQREISGLQSRVEGRVEKRAGETESITGEERNIALAEQAASSAEEAIERIDARLAPYLAPLKISPAALDASDRNIRSDLVRLCKAWAHQETARDAAAGELESLDARLATARQALATADQSLEEARQTESKRQSAKAALDADRSGILGGEPTEQHRARHENDRLEAIRLHEEARQAHAETAEKKASAVTRRDTAEAAVPAAETEEAEARLALDAKLTNARMTRETLADLLALGQPEAERLRAYLKTLDDALTGAISALLSRKEDLARREEAGIPGTSEAELREQLTATEALRDTRRERIGAITERLKADDEARARLKDLEALIGTARQIRDTWMAVNEAVGSRDGGKFARIAQAVTLSMLVERANLHLSSFKPRYSLSQGGDDLSLHVMDADMGDEIRSTRSLSGGERFLVSLSLALALSQLNGQAGLASTLFIDEGFGALDADSLDMAMEALETLQAQGRTIGVISHVEAMKDRIPVQLRVARTGAGASAVSIFGQTLATKVAQ